MVLFLYTMKLYAYKITRFNIIIKLMSIGRFSIFLNKYILWIFTRNNIDIILCLLSKTLDIIRLWYVAYLMAVLL